MESTIPCLDKFFFLNILQLEVETGGQQGKVSVVNCTSEPGVDGACNFLSTIIRFKVEYTIDNQDKILTRSFLIKAPLSDTVINEDILIKNEVHMYDEMIPKIVEIAHLEVAPKTFNCPWHNCLVMEDLKDAGYEMCSAIKKLDHKHAKAALITLAKFHAASVAVKNSDPDLMARNGEETVYTHDPKYAVRFKPRVLMRLYGLARVLLTIEGCEKFGEVLIDAGEEFWDLIVEVFRPNSKLNVLNHGDFWTNNMLFKHDSEGLISDVKFVDYQLRRYCSPAIDLLYLFWTSADTTVQMKMYELLEMYRHALNSSLAELGCSERLSRQELKEEISKCSPLILLICLYLPVIFPDPDSPFDVHEVVTSEDSIKSFDFDVNPILLPFKSMFFRRVLPEMCKELENMKVFQVLLKNRK